MRTDSWLQKDKQILWKKKWRNTGKCNQMCNNIVRISLNVSILCAKTRTTNALQPHWKVCCAQGFVNKCGGFDVVSWCRATNVQAHHKQNPNRLHSYVTDDAVPAMLHDIQAYSLMWTRKTHILFPTATRNERDNDDDVLLTYTLIFGKWFEEIFCINQV